MCCEIITEKNFQNYGTSYYLNRNPMNITSFINSHISLFNLLAITQTTKIKTILESEFSK